MHQPQHKNLCLQTSDPSWQIIYISMACLPNNYFYRCRTQTSLAWLQNLLVKVVRGLTHYCLFVVCR